MCPLVAGHPHIAEFSSHRRNVAPNVKQPEELGLLLGRVGPGPLAAGGHPSLTPPAVPSIRRDPRPHRRRPNRAPTIPHPKQHLPLARRIPRQSPTHPPVDQTTP